MNQSDMTLKEELNSEEVGRLTPLLVFLGLIAGTGLPGNVIVVLIYGQTFRTSVSHFFIWWLAVMDIISCCVLFLEIVNVVNQVTYSNEWLCKCTIFFTIWPVLTSGFALCLIGIDRFRKVCRPLDTQISYKRATVMITVTVCIALCFSWPSLIIYGIYEKPIAGTNLTGSGCAVQNKYRGTLYMQVYSGFLWLLFVSSVIFISVVYIIIGKKIFTQIKKRRNSSPGSSFMQMNQTEGVSGDDNTSDTSSSRHKSIQTLYRANSMLERKFSTISRGNEVRISSRRQAKARKSAFIMFLISAVFVVSFLPYLILRVNEAFDQHFVESMTDAGRAVYKFFLRTYFLNCAANPFIYCACAPSFRKEVKLFFSKTWERLVAAIR